MRLNSTRPAPVPFLDLAALHERHRGELDRAWSSVLELGWFVGGPFVERFESDFADYCGADHCIGVGNGTDAIELILAGLGIGPGDEVIVPANTFVATCEAVHNVGASFVFVDVDPATLLLDIDAVAAAIGPRTAGVIAVDLYGQMPNLVALRSLCERRGVDLIEDAAQAHGARYAGDRSGALSSAAAFSFYPGKNLGALGDGGAVVTNDAGLARRIRQLADHGRTSDRYVHGVAGRNSRLDALQAAVLSTKLPSLDTDNAARRAVWATYLAMLPEWCSPVQIAPDAESVHHLAVVEVDDRAGVSAALTAHGIGWGIHYPIPCHRQAPFAAEVRLPVVEAAADRIISLPVFPSMTTDQVATVCEVIDAAASPGRFR